MIKNFILMCLGAFIVAFADNHVDNLIVEIIICSLGFGLIFNGYGNMITKPLLKRINSLNMYSYIDKNFLQAIEEGFNETSFIFSKNELKEYKDYIDLYRRKHGSIVYKIEYEVDEDSTFIYKCKFVKAYDMNEKEWIDEQRKTIHLFRSINNLNYIHRTFENKKEIEVEFRNKKYSCIVTSFLIVDEYDEDGDKMIEIDLLILKELVDNIEINERKVEVSSKSGSYKHTYIEENNG